MALLAAKLAGGGSINHFILPKETFACLDDYGKTWMLQQRVTKDWIL